MPASNALYDREKCRRRTAMAAARGIEATPVKFYGSAPPADVEEGEVISASGDLPQGAEAVDRINRILGLAGARRLREDQIYVRYLEAGNTNYVKSRLMFLAPSTLANIARAADDGFAFMNSHRTGGLSSDPEMPLGRTFAGRHEKLAIRHGREFHRTTIGFYMVRGQKPNGESGPSTDALAAGIDAGTIFDVSLGLKGPARVVCDVCDNDLYGRDEDGNPLCPHVPGTRKFLTDDQQDAQRNRGVDDGVATYSIHDATAGEVSAVFDGAVTGAGFRRMLSAYSRGELSGANLAEARLSYGPILAARFDLGRSPKARRRHNPQRSVVMAKRDKALPGQGILLPDLIDQIRDGEIDPNDITVNLSGGGDDGRSGQGGGNRPAETPETAQLREQLAETNRRLEAAEKRAQKEAEDRLAERRAAALATVDRDADAAVEANRERLTGETAKTFRAALCQAGRDDLDHPLDGGARRFDQISALQAGAPARDVTRERIATSKPEALPNYGASGNDSATNLEEDVKAQNAKYMPKGTRIESKAG